MSDAILIGPVTTRKGYRLHLAESGRAHCGAGRGRILRTVALQPAHEAQLCRRCIKATRQAVQDASSAAVASEGNAYREDAVQDLAAIAEALMTPARRLERACKHAAMVEEIRARLLANGSLVDRMAATVELAPAVQSRPENARRRTWADLRDDFTATHKQPTLAA